MDNIEYLQAAREANREWVLEFRTRFGITEAHDDYPKATDLYEAHQHHSEYGGASH